MRRTRRRVNTFNLSFLDIMACGFGAVTLLFLILKHDDSTALEGLNSKLNSEINLLSEDLRNSKEQQTVLRNRLALSQKELVETRNQGDRTLKALEEKRRELGLQKDSQDISRLRQQVEALEQEIERVREREQSADLVELRGQGDRQYLTGLKLGGERILILVDASASMLDDSLVNIIRRRNMADPVKLQSPKWQRTLKTVEWLIAQLPRHSRYQLYTFSTRAEAGTPGTAGQWLETSNSQSIANSLDKLRRTIPARGTSLINAFAAIDDFSLKPDNLFLITDGLPTLGKSRNNDNTISGKKRVRLFQQAVTTLPSRLPVNVILLPMEGDPEAAGLFWQLGLTTGGAFLSPAQDWP